MLVAFVGMLCYGHCQDVKVNINNQEATTKEDCAYRINGICSTEDIGGVDVEIYAKEDGIRTPNYTYDNIYAQFKNYNESTVTVLYEIGNEDLGSGRCTGTASPDGKTGSIVLQPGENKSVKLHSNGYSSYAQKYFIRGMIVRKLK